MAQALLLALGAELVHLGLQQVGGAAGDDLVAADGLLAHFLVDLAGQLAVLAAEQALGLLGNHLVALAGQHVQHSLRAHNLAGGGNQGRIAKVLPHVGDFLQHSVILVLGVGLLQLGNQVGQHAAGHLVQQGVHVHLQHLGVDVQLLGHAAEVGSGLHQLGHIQAGVTAGALQGGHHGLGGGLGGAVCQGGQSAVHNVHAGLGSHQVGHVAGAGGVVGVQVDGHADVLLQLLHQGVRVIGQQQVRHVLDADGVGAHLLQLHGQLDEVVLAVHGALGVADGSLHHAAVLLDELHGSFHVAGVVQSVENTHHIDAVFDGLLAEGLHHVVGIVPVAQDVLAAEQHLQLGVGQALFQGAQALPGVFVQKAHAHVEGGAAPAL